MTETANPTAVTRNFIYNGRSLPDPDAGMSLQQVQQFYAGIHPELLNATIEGGEFDGDAQTFTFARGIGTKG